MNGAQLSATYASCLLNNKASPKDPKILNHSAFSYTWGHVIHNRSIMLLGTVDIRIDAGASESMDGAVLSTLKDRKHNLMH